MPRFATGRNAPNITYQLIEGRGVAKNPTNQGKTSPEKPRCARRDHKGTSAIGKDSQQTSEAPLGKVPKKEQRENLKGRRGLSREGTVPPKGGGVRRNKKKGGSQRRGEGSCSQDQPKLLLSRVIGKGGPYCPAAGTGGNTVASSHVGVRNERRKTKVQKKKKQRHTEGSL